MNIPTRSEDGRKIRDCFVASDGCEFLAVDYSQIELRTLAHEAQEGGMIKVFQSGGDIHSMTASEISGIPIDRVPSDIRRIAKVTNFGIVYGISASGLHESLAKEGADISVWTEDRCGEFIDQWLTLYPKVLSYMKEREVEARRYGYVRDMWGRIRRIPEMKSAHPWIVSAGIRECQNFGIQSGAQGIIKKAMGELVPYYRQWLREGVIVRPVVQIHDELLFEVGKGELETLYILLKSVMESAIELSVPVIADGKRGKAWGSMTKIKQLTS